MNNSRLFSVLTNLEGYERRELVQWVQSPFFNRRREVSELFHLLVHSYFELNIIPEKTEVFATLCPGQSYDAQRVRQWMSWLLELIEQYFAYKELAQDILQRKLHLARAYRHRRHYAQFDRHWQDLAAQRLEQPFRSDNYYETGYFLERERYLFTATQQRTGEHKLQSLSDQTDLAFVLRKLRQACLMLAHQAVNQTEYSIGFLSEVLKYAETLSVEDHPAIAVYYHGYRMLESQSHEDHFPVFRALMMTYRQLFPDEEWRDLLLLAINYCIRQFNQGEEKFATEGLELYKVGLESQLLLTDGQLSRFAYRNIVALALKVGDLALADRFIHEYKRALPTAHRESMFSFSLARLEYQRGHYDAALLLLQKAEYTDVLLNLAAKTLQIKIFFERNEWDWLQAHLDAMHNFIRRKRLLGYHRQNYLGVVRYTRMLMAVNPYDKQGVENLRKKLLEEEMLTEKDWLLDQLNQL